MPYIKSAKRNYKLSRLIVRPRFDDKSASSGRLQIGAVQIQAALGRNGLAAMKREGDGRTPLGRFRLAPGYLRPDRSRGLPMAGLAPLSPAMGWCDDPQSGAYNRPVPAGARARHERLWRNDVLYDVVFPTDHNQRPRVKGLGSAIFFHVAKHGYPGTEGCVAISRDDMRRLLPRLARGAKLIVTR